MAPTLRNSTKQNTIASAQKAETHGFKWRPRSKPSKKQLNTTRYGSVTSKAPKELEAITIANAANSPLLRLPAEIRNMIFRFAVTPTFGSWVDCYFNRRGRISRSGTSTRLHKGDRKDLALSLPEVCRQIYTETAVLVYSENTFAFQSEKAMYKWISKRLQIQRQAIRYLMMPSYHYQEAIDLMSNPFMGENSLKPQITERVKKLCPNLVRMKEDDWLDDLLCGSPRMCCLDSRSRETDPSSSDESPYDHYDSEDEEW